MEVFTLINHLCSINLYFYYFLDWLPSFQSFFILLSLLPETSLGKQSSQSKRLTFYEAVSRIIIFKPVIYFKNIICSKKINYNIISAKFHIRRITRKNFYFTIPYSDWRKQEIHYSVYDLYRT